MEDINIWVVKQVNTFKGKFKVFCFKDKEKADKFFEENSKNPLSGDEFIKPEMLPLN